MWRPFYLVIPTNNLATKWNAILCSNHVTFKTILQNYCHAVLFTCSSMSEVCKQQLIQVVWFVKWKHKHAAKENQVVWQIHMSVLFYSRYSRTSQFSWSCIHWRTRSLTHSDHCQSCPVWISFIDISIYCKQLLSFSFFVSQQKKFHCILELHVVELQIYRVWWENIMFVTACKVSVTVIWRHPWLIVVCFLLLITSEK